MIIRIVRMTFQEDRIHEFMEVFNERKERIRHFNGCRHLELWQDAHIQNVYLTYSIWDTEQHLDHYRFSELFKDTWAKTKVLFADRPVAWSMNRAMTIE